MTRHPSNNRRDWLTSLRRGDSVRVTCDGSDTHGVVVERSTRSIRVRARTDGADYDRLYMANEGCVWTGAGRAQIHPWTYDRAEIARLCERLREIARSRQGVHDHA